MKHNLRKNLQRLRDYDEDVYNDVMKSNPRSWCRAFYKIDGECCEDVENNTIESFNNSIGKAREKPVLPMLETIRRLAMTQISLRKTKASNHPSKFTPYVQKILDEEHEDADICTIWPGTSGKFEVETVWDSERVNMTDKTCTSCKWDITGIPCVHAYGVILKRNLDPDDYVSDWFLTTRWRGTYNEAMIPLRVAGHWSRGDISLVGIPLEPPQPGRKKNRKKQKRKKGLNESPSKKKKNKRKNLKRKTQESPKKTQPKRTMHCKKCGGAGHNSRPCAKRAKRGHGKACASQVDQDS
ncbi:PREDICTED: uncharacterized protein LOC104792471 [Camelina sativa]|uniref:Uncharacterized protein LOC104792471 n=1 Tax=Camelina sativa TaxID=90675 RepID=A0ABM0ZK98_CAMSA|nr:PREDICTED: uncharacterized protein LOC104792471 [Camelina sativa]XP_010516933.1 PREDICTED: uncharacterized protein LOC104792471 [Camelina sativa]